MSTDNSQYTDQTYWDKRYKRDVSSGNEISNPIYEWYLGFEDIIKLINEDISSSLNLLRNKKQINSLSASILVSGCGNSSLCEDLVHYGCL